MAEHAIEVAALSKCYRLPALGVRPPYQTMRDALSGLFRHSPPTHERPLWALRDVSFDVPMGTVLGVVGRNGAGKSTLLKILSRVTEPTSGRAVLNGRVGSLLEVGTGFHPELSGRENLLFNGAVLGMSRRETESKLDQIVAFAEVEPFLDVPVKRYSTGMQMRLAFSIAAHLEPDILIVDEVLAVGDVAFQRKCLGRMESVAGEGRTVLFVSHNLSVVRQLCSKGILLKEGTIACAGPIAEVLSDYLHEIDVASELCFPDREEAAVSIVRLSLVDADGHPTGRIPHSQSFTTEIEYVVRKPMTADRLWWQLSNAEGVEIMGSGDQDTENQVPDVRPPGRYLARVTFPGGVLNAGIYQYRVAVASVSGPVADYRHGHHFEIDDDSDFGSLNSGGRRNGVLLRRLRWEEQRLS